MKKNNFLIYLLGLFIALSFSSCSDDDTEPLSVDATLKALTPSKGSLLPAFSAATTQYSLSLTDELSFVLTKNLNDTKSKITVVGTNAEGGSLTIKGDSIKGLSYGDNNVKLAVVAQDTSKKKTYNITVTVNSTTPQRGKLLLYLDFNDAVKDAISGTTISKNTISYGTARKTSAGKAGSFAGAGQIVEANIDPLANSSLTISFWMYVDTMKYVICGIGGNKGMAIQVSNFDYDKLKTGTKIKMGLLKVLTGHENSGTGAKFAQSWFECKTEGNTLSDQLLFDYNAFENNVEGNSIYKRITKTWVQVVLTYDASTTIKTVYVSGEKIRQEKLTNSVSTEWKLGNFAYEAGDGVVKHLVIGAPNSPDNTSNSWWNYSSTSTFKGLIDDFRIWKTALTSTEVSDLYNLEK